MKRYLGLHALTQCGWWGFLSLISSGLTTLYVPKTIEGMVISFGVTGLGFYLSHKVGKHCSWI